MGNGFAFACWVRHTYSYLARLGDFPVFYATVRDEWRLMQRRFSQHPTEKLSAKTT